MNCYQRTACLLLAFLILTAAAPAVAVQEVEPDPAAAEEAPPAERGNVQFIDAPVAIDPASDFALPPPPRPENLEQDPRFAQRQQTIRSYLDSVQRIELAGGAWSEELTEELSALGTLQQQQDAHEDAVESFSRAIHITRINSGLHTLEQVPLVEKMLDSFLALGDWEQADVYNEYLFYVQQQAYGRGDPRLIPVMERLAHWNIEAFIIGYGDFPARRLSSAQMLFHTAAEMVGLHFGNKDERYIDYLYGIANSAYLVATNPDVLQEAGRAEFRSSQEQLRDKLNAGEWIVPRGFSAGEDALLAIAKHYAAQSGAGWELARVTADIGDWYLIAQRRTSAAGKYREAWDILEGLENGAELQQRLFGQVRPIPTFLHGTADLLETNAGSAGANLTYDFIDLILDVTENGLVRNIRLANENTRATGQQVSRIERLVREAYFRPLVINGDRVRSTDNYFRYRYWY